MIKNICFIKPVLYDKRLGYRNHLELAVMTRDYVYI